MKRTVLIADDEPSAREYLLRLLGARQDLEVVGGMKNGQEVIDFCKTLHPDIILLDIEMPGVSGLEAAKHLTRNLRKSVIIFITAFDQYAIEAFEFATIGYLLKPFNPADLDRVLDRAINQLETVEKANFSDRMEALWDQLERKTKTHLTQFEIKEKGLIRTVDVSEILYIRSESEYVQLVTKGRSYLQRLSIKVLAEQLPPTFHRIHRTYILNEQYVKSWKYQSDGRFQFVLTNGEILSSSRSFKTAISQWMD